MEYLIICAVALFVSGLTLFSGFGLGTVLMPAFALFCPVPVAVAATALVHLSNNLFKTLLVGRKGDWSVIAVFALPGAGAAMAGAFLLDVVDRVPPLAVYQLGNQRHEITLVGLLIGILISGFALLDLLPRFRELAFDRKYLPYGGLLSGFFGGISGMQGALRSAFLIKAGLSKEAFIGTATVSAVIVDAARLLVYGWSFFSRHFEIISPALTGLILAATSAAFLGSFIGARLIKKVTLKTIQIIVGLMLVLIGLGLAGGLM
ncbi:MAG: sulfite exporter TauE/SafE family protein [Deltaproteobacteria bacterium]|nr:sulfite exporter TauE/SafE family protein [Deltaproteobacteria bacterium]